MAGGAARLDDGMDTFLPSVLLRLDGRVRETWTPPLFVLSSNGLASGNTEAEAVLHGLYEVVERDSLTRAESVVPRRLELTSVTGPARDLLDRLAAAEVDVRVEVLPSPTGLACFRATIWSEAFPVRFAGAGAHLDREVALCRALTEAAQSRVTEIAGARDDLTAGAYRRAASGLVGPAGVARSDRTGRVRRGRLRPERKPGRGPAHHRGARTGGDRPVPAGRAAHPARGGHPGRPGDLSRAALRSRTAVRKTP